MPTSPPKHRAAGYRSKDERNKEADERRGTSQERGYGSRWQNYRRTFLQAHPLCAMCEAKGRITPATVVDHITPHRGDQSLFWQRSNHQALCRHHHSSTKQRDEKKNKINGIQSP